MQGAGAFNYIYWGAQNKSWRKIKRQRDEGQQDQESWRGKSSSEGLREDLRKPLRGTLVMKIKSQEGELSEVLGGPLRDPLGGRFSPQRPLSLVATLRVHPRAKLGIVCHVQSWSHVHQPRAVSYFYLVHLGNTTCSPTECSPIES